MLKAIENETERVFEKVDTHTYDTAGNASVAVAAEIATLIKTKAEAGENCVLGLATGSTPKQVYAELVRLHKEEGLSFKNVITYNLDEYYPMQPDAEQSYVLFMKQQLFDHVDIPVANYNVPDGTLAKDKIVAYCDDYERRIEADGGLDLQILGIGGNGHIGFNECGSLISSKTRLIALDEITRINAQNDFYGLDKTPRRAITLGVQKIMEAKRVILMAWGEKKANIIAKSVEGDMSSSNPATYLQTHPNCSFVLDEYAAAELTRVAKPWVVGSIEWNDELIRQAVIGLAEAVGKPLLKLTDKDYNEHGLNDLLVNTKDGSCYDINIKVFNELQNTITGWPGGKPDADDSTRPERALPAKKRVLVFSPHPDDDIISMGGTLIRLVEQGHEVHVAYQTSGNIAVSDDEAIRFADFITDLNDQLKLGASSKLLKGALASTEAKKHSNDSDTAEVRTIKGLIRRSEAKATCRFVEVEDKNVHFLDLPFYETGEVKKKPLGQEDIDIVAALIEEIKPHQVFAAGDLADPHGTHKVCLDAIFAAVEQLKSKPFMQDCWVWMYRGAWEEWGIHEIEMAVPMSPIQVLQKRHGIFKHQSQKDGVVFQGGDSREFWQRAEDRNSETAEKYKQLGLSEYAAIEAFKRYFF